MANPSRSKIPKSRNFEIGRILHLKSEIRNFKLDAGLERCAGQFTISDFGFAVQESSNFKISDFLIARPWASGTRCTRLNSWRRAQPRQRIACRLLCRSLAIRSAAPASAHPQLPSPLSCRRRAAWRREDDPVSWSFEDLPPRRRFWSPAVLRFHPVLFSEYSLLSAPHYSVLHPECLRVEPAT